MEPNERVAAAASERVEDAVDEISDDLVGFASDLVRIRSV